jgi:hypothetical protein
MAKYTHKTTIYSTGTFFFPANPSIETNTQQPSSTTNGQYRISTEA